MRGKVMLAGWKNMHPEEQYLGKYIDLYEHIADKCYVARTERFERWYENAIDLPGRYYLQAIEELFKANRFARGEFVGLGRKLSLKDVKIPLYLLAAGQTTSRPGSRRSRPGIWSARRIPPSSRNWHQAVTSACSWAQRPWLKFGRRSATG